MQNSRVNPRIQRPNHLHLVNKIVVENVDLAFGSSSDDDSSPEMNCKKVIDKPTLVSFL